MTNDHLASLRTQLDTSLSDSARTWFDRALDAAATAHASTAGASTAHASAARASTGEATSTAHEPTAHEPAAHEPAAHEPAGHEGTRDAPTGHEPTGHEGTRDAPTGRASTSHAPTTEATTPGHGSTTAPTATADGPPADPQGPPPTWELRFAEAGRRCGAPHADTARILLLHTARADLATLTRLYHRGTADERRAVLLSLPYLLPGPDALPLTEDALRTNDTRLVAAAVGPYGAAHLDAHNWRHAVLKCLFTGVPVTAIADLDRRARADTELARMLGDYAQERTAAGRPVPGDLHRVLALTAPSVPDASLKEG